MLDDPATETPQIPGYRILRRLGEGGMATVYLATQESLDREVAIKVIAREALRDEISKQRFEQEAHTIAQLEHPCIVGIHEVGRSSEGLLYYAMPYLPNGDLSTRDYRNDEPRIVETLRMLLTALDYAHERGIVHRDVKAENVLFDHTDQPRLTDFGIALSKRNTMRITTTGFALGSGATMAPEQAKGEDVDGRADLYSVGVLAFEMLAGHLPYQSPEPLALALMHMQDPIPRLPPDKRHWQGFIDTAMAKIPEERYRDAKQMLYALDHLDAQGVHGLRRLIAARPWRHPAVLFGSGLVLAAAIAAWLWMRVPQSDRPEPSATASASRVAVPPARAAPTPPPLQEAPVADAEQTDELTPLLATAARQIENENLTRPAGANAAETLLAAAEFAPDDVRVAVARDELLRKLGDRIVLDLGEGRDDDASATYVRAARFAKAAGSSDDASWRDLQQIMRNALGDGIDKAVAVFDRAGAERAIAIARKHGLLDEALEARLAAVAALPKPGDAVRDDGGPALIYVGAVAGGRQLLAMRDEVTRGDYAEFTEQMRRPAAKCPAHDGSSSLGLFSRRSWNRPGFEQGDRHPVVCVSWADAEAYARWLSARTGERYRLPTAAEWRALAGYADQGRSSKAAGTFAAGDTGAGPLGVRDLHGNVSEWLADGSAGQRLVAGLSWRDAPGRMPWTWTGAQRTDQGYDDVGFRLVREMREVPK